MKVGGYMKVILKSGIVIPNVQSQDRTKNPMGLWVWANKQAVDQLLSFEGITIRASQIAAIIEEEIEINITEKDLPF
jgi:hypothetical protein